MATAREVPVPASVDTEQIDQDRIALERSTRELADHFKELLSQFPDQWIALLRSSEGRTVASGKTLEELDTEIVRRDLPRNQIAVHYMDTQRRVWIL